MPDAPTIAAIHGLTERIEKLEANRDRLLELIELMETRLDQTLLLVERLIALADKSRR